VLVPNDSIVTLRSLDGSLRVEGLQGDVILEAATARVDAAAITGAHLHIKTLSGPVTLTDIRDSHLDIRSDIRNVTGAFVEVSSGSGRITYDGDPGFAGYCRLTSHTGDLDVSIPASATVDIKARSLKGEPDQPSLNVDDVVPMDQKKLFAKPGMVGASRIVLRSFKGKIRLKRP
jgi:hypothetical protein